MSQPTNDNNNATALWGCVSAVLVALIGGVVTLIANNKMPLLAPFFDPPTATPFVVTLTAPPPPATSGCPTDARANWLQYRDTWYGPWDNYYLRYDVDYFYVSDNNQLDPNTGYYGLQTSYSTHLTRNAWQQLLQSPFWVCIDTDGNVFGIYQP